MRNTGYLLLLLILFSCQEEVTLPLASLDEEVPVIEAIWTDNSYYNEIKVSLAEDYFDTTDLTIISEAEVAIYEVQTGEMIPFRFDNDTKSFRPVNESQIAKVGQEYEAQVKWKDETFKARGTMLEPPILDSLTYSYQEERLFRDEGYYIKVYGKIPFEEDNYYRIKVIENDTLQNDRDDYLLFDDTFGLKFFEEGLELNYPFEEGDRVRLELFRMNKSAYDYFNELVGLLFNDGGLFSPPPQNPESNFTDTSGEGKVLGYFLVSPILNESIVIKEED